jgi:hypothetical protein
MELDELKRYILESFDKVIIIEADGDLFFMN